jgi:hypothetical protein
MLWISRSIKIKDQGTENIDGVEISFKGATAMTSWERALNFAPKSADKPLFPTPGEFLQVLQISVPYKLKIAVKIDAAQEGFCATLLGISAKENEDVVFVNLSIAPQHRAVMSRADVLRISDRGRGLLKPLMSNIVQYLQRFSAAGHLYIGARNTYSWVPYGFCPINEREWNKLVHEIGQRFDRVKNQLHGSQVQRVDNILCSHDPSSIRAIAEMRDALVNDLPLGRFLLSDLPRWHGMLNIRDAGDMAYFQRHITGADRPTSNVAVKECMSLHN